MPLSKNWTLKKVEDVLRNLVNEIAPDKVQSLTFTDYINIATQDVAEMLASASQPDYGTKQVVTQTNDVIDISTYNVDKIIKLTDDVNGLILPAKDFEFENLANLPQKQDNIFYNHFGEEILLYKGSNVTAYGTTLTLYYYRQPALASSSSDYLDIKDKYVPLVLAKAKNLVYEQLKTIPPESLTSLIESKTAQIRNLNREENQAIKDRSKGNR